MTTIWFISASTNTPPKHQHLLCTLTIQYACTHKEDDDDQDDEDDEDVEDNFNDNDNDKDDNDECFT